MSEEEENNASQPPKKPKVLGVFPATSDAHLVLRKASTWLGVLAAGSVGALGAYAMAPARAQDMVPGWALAVLISMGMVSGFAVGVATSIKQQGLQR